MNLLGQLLEDLDEAVVGLGQLLDLDILVTDVGQTLQRGAVADGGDTGLAAEVAAVGAEGKRVDRRRDQSIGRGRLLP